MLPARIHRATETPAKASNWRNLPFTRTGPKIEITLNVAPPIAIGKTQYRTSQRIRRYSTLRRVPSRGGLLSRRTR